MATSKEYLKKMLDNGNVKAAIATIRKTEGTTAPDGHLYMYGSSPKNKIRFKDTSTHPNIVQVHNNIRSTAAGIGQWLFKTYKTLCSKYGLSGFDMEAQMLLFVATFDDLGVLNDIAKGKMLQEGVMSKLSKCWASLPYAAYGQPTHSMADVRGYYQSAGGVFIA